MQIKIYSFVKKKKSLESANFRYVETKKKIIGKKIYVGVREIFEIGQVFSGKQRETLF